MKTRGMRWSAAGRTVAVLAGLTLGPAMPGAAAAQAVEEVCGSPTETFHRPCREVTLAVHAARAGVGLAAAGGASLPGTNSTLGKRIGSSPRLALVLRGGLTRAPGALVDDVPALGDVAAPGDRAWLTSLRADLGAGLFDGFSVAPTVGGILSVDLLGTLSLVGASSGDGFGDGTVKGAGLGVRVGVVRESFTLPGVTVSATRRWLGESTIGDYGEAGSGARFDNTVTSVRGVVGKDLFAVGFLAGVGWDRYGGDARIQASTGDSFQSREADDMTADRMLFFGGASWNFLVLQIAGEAGWARGLDAPPGRPAGGFDPGEGTAFGSLSFRLVF